MDESGHIYRVQDVIDKTPKQIEADEERLRKALQASDEAVAKHVKELEEENQ